MEICPTCKQEIKKQRSKECSDHFHAHVTQAARETGIERDYIYQIALLRACEIKVEGGAEYPYTIVSDVLYPKRTTGRTNKEMMTAIEAIHMISAEMGVFLTETEIKEEK